MKATFAPVVQGQVQNSICTLKMVHKGRGEGPWIVQQLQVSLLNYSVVSFKINLKRKYD